jgi:hypothetical protein
VVVEIYRERLAGFKSTGPVELFDEINSRQGGRKQVQNNYDGNQRAYP